MGGEAFALEQDAAGVYQLGTAQDLNTMTMPPMRKASCM